VLNACMHACMHACMRTSRRAANLLDMLSVEVGHDLDETAVVIHRARHSLALLNHAVLEAHAVIVLAERRRLERNTVLSV
jgi:hypothetical protein